MSGTGTEVSFELANGSGPSASFGARARAAREALLKQQSVRLEVPNYEGVLAVEYRAVSYQESKRIQERLARVKDEAEKEIYAAADHLLLASFNAYDLTCSPVREIGFGWGIGLAKAMEVEISEGMTPRQALLACFPREQLLLTHFYNDYSDWLSGATVDVDEEQVRDFPPTP